MEYAYGIISPNAATSLQLQHFLQEHDAFFCVSVDPTAGEGIKSLLKFKPDVVFVDLDGQAAECFRMWGELAQYLEAIPAGVAMASSNSYAYDALKNQFFDYWILPLEEFEIRKTLLKLQKRLPRPEVPTTICLQSYKDYQYLNTGDILYLQADNNATDFVLADGRRVSAYKTLKSFEGQLPPNFVRIHQSYILNCDYVSRIHYGKNRCTLRGGRTELPFSRGYRKNVDALKELLTQKAYLGHS